MSGWFYRAFEDRYRGSRDIIRDRLGVYLPYVQPLAQDGGAALDLGCGRGEWLELLNEAGFAAEGVDLDEGMLEACRERGLRVLNGDALAILRARPDASVAVVSAFHLVEHIAFEQVQTLIAEALRVLQPGGLLILETPNPENLVVGASSFYDDPSHLRPVPPKLLAFAIEFTGFARHSVLRLQESEKLRSGAPVALFDVLGGVSPDYSVVAQKGGTPAQLAALDVPFATSHGVDLHTLAQYYQQQQDAVREEFAQLHDQQGAIGLALQQQLAKIDEQIAHVHAATVALAADIAQNEAARAALAEQLEQVATVQADAIERLKRAESAEVASRLERAEAAVAAWLNGTDATHAGFTERLDRIESLALRAETAAKVSGEQSASRLRRRVSDIQERHQSAVDESARLAAHVAWIESRLNHAEADAATLRQQLSELQHRSLGARVARALRQGRQRLAGAGAGAGSVPRLRQPAYALLRRLVQGVLRRPGLKRVARSAVARFPRLHTRLLQLMYAPAPPDPATQVDADPLASEMSPRSLKIYRALVAASKHKD